MAFAIGRQLFRRGSVRNIACHVMPVDTVKGAPFQPVFRQESHELRRENDIQIRGEHKFTASTANTGVLGDHLMQRNCIRVLESPMNFRRNFDKSNLTRTGILGPMQHVDQLRPIGRWIPFHDDNLGRQAVSFRLAQPGIQKSLHARQHVSTMIVIPGGHNHRNIRRVLRKR